MVILFSIIKQRLEVEVVGVTILLRLEEMVDQAVGVALMNLLALEPQGHLDRVMMVALAKLSG